MSASISCSQLSNRKGQIKWFVVGLKRFSPVKTTHPFHSVKSCWCAISTRNLNVAQSWFRLLLVSNHNLQAFVCLFFQPLRQMYFSSYQRQQTVVSHSSKQSRNSSYWFSAINTISFFRPEQKGQKGDCCWCCCWYVHLHKSVVGTISPLLEPMDLTHLADVRIRGIKHSRLSLTTSCQRHIFSLWCFTSCVDEDDVFLSTTAYFSKLRNPEESAKSTKDECIVGFQKEFPEQSFLNCKCDSVSFCFGVCSTSCQDTGKSSLANPESDCKSISSV